MRTYYNEFDPFAAAWLRELMRDGLIPVGEVDERSIADVQPDDLRGYDQCHFFAGIGGWAYALQLAEWGDRPVWTGSCPCQPFSAAGKGQAEDDPRHLWPYWFRLIRECHPERVFGEQVASAAGHGWLDLVCTDLEAEGYAVGAVILGAHSVGAPHLRQRLWFVADSNGSRLPQRHVSRDLGTPEAPPAWGEFERVHAAGAWKEREAQSNVPVFADGVPNRVGTLRGAGNAINPYTAKAFVRAYLECVVSAPHGAGATNG